MGPLEQHKLTAVGIISAIVLISSFSLGFILEPEEVVFIPDKNSMINDVEQLVSLGPRVTGSTAESEAAEYISQRFNEIGLTNVQIREYQVTTCWFEDADPDEHQILMHAQLEQGTPNAPLLPDGTAAVSYTHLTLPTNREV